MSRIFEPILRLIKQKNVVISDHGYDALAEDGIFVEDILASVNDAVVIEDYPEYPKGQCVLVLQADNQGKPIHVVWGIPKALHPPPFWSLLTDQTQRDGQVILEGQSHEKKALYKNGA